MSICIDWGNGKDMAEKWKLELVTTCVGFDDILDLTLPQNHPQVDTLIVVTSHEDKKTQMVAKKHGAMLVVTDLFKKNGRNFNKGAAINAGFDYWQWHGWRMHIDSDIALPDNFRRVLFNHTVLDTGCIYAADRVDVVGKEGLDRALGHAQHSQGMFVTTPKGTEVSHRFVHNLHGFQPLGYFQLWHCSCQKPYPYSLGTAAHDDIMFASLWPETQRRLLPSIFTYHVVARANPVVGENWDGNRRQPRLDGK
jgi:hypothetical protein